MNRWSSKKEAVQKIKGISTLASKGQSHERRMNRWSSEKEAVQDIGGTAG